MNSICSMNLSQVNVYLNHYYRFLRYMPKLMLKLKKWKTYECQNYERQGVRDIKPKLKSILKFESQQNIKISHINQKKI
jgi:hypothetical protein